MSISNEAPALVVASMSAPVHSVVERIASMSGRTATGPDFGVVAVAAPGTRSPMFGRETTARLPRPAVTSGVSHCHVGLRTNYLHHPSDPLRRQLRRPSPREQ